MAKIVRASQMIDIMGIVHPSSRTGARGGTVYVDPLNAKGVETDIYHIKPTKFVGDSQLNGKLQEVVREFTPGCQC